MTVLDNDRARAALAPLVTELLRRATADAGQVRADAQAAVGAALASAESTAKTIESGATAAGEAHATADLAAERAHARRTGRSEILAVQSDAYRQLRAEAIAAVQRIGTEAEYPLLHNRLRTVVSELLGPEAVITDDPSGGIVAVTGDRLVDLRLSTIATRAIERVEPELGELWTPAGTVGRGPAQLESSITRPR
ncbi:hypothetical protein ABZ942_19490 [Nocardia sp. NPDC046473]|uniref:hypothetical protein n=1 Tax=Nocardia sp. NPDC046473 TaxID=3155733 RepID=UPI0033FE2DBE